jgi:cholesterol oxidase
MRGPFALGETEPASGERAGRRAATELALHARLAIPDAKQFVRDPQHAGLLDGWVAFGPLGGDLPVRSGAFQLFTRNSGSASKLMVYRAIVERGADAYCLDGAKHVGKRGIVHSWQETTTLHCRLHAGRTPSGPVVGAGILRLSPAAFASQLLSFGTVDGRGVMDRASALARFFLFFSRELIDSYVLPRAARRREQA